MTCTTFTAAWSATLVSKRPVPRLHKRLVNMGLSAACAAWAIHRYRHEREGLAHEVLRAAWQNRASLKQALPGSAQYR